MRYSSFPSASSHDYRDQHEQEASECIQEQANESHAGAKGTVSSSVLHCQSRTHAIKKPSLLASYPPQLQNAGVFARKQHHALSKKAIKKRERHDKHVLAGVLYAPASSSSSVDATAAPTSAMQTEQVFTAAGHALAAKGKKLAGTRPCFLSFPRLVFCCGFVSSAGRPVFKLVSQAMQCSNNVIAITQFQQGLYNSDRV